VALYAQLAAQSGLPAARAPYKGALGGLFRRARLGWNESSIIGSMTMMINDHPL